jgi:hypothetical protein
MRNKGLIIQRLIAGQMPLYPSLARAAHIIGTVELQITVE